MSVLTYKHHAQIEDLHVGECTIHRASGSGPARWWLLWFNVLRDNDGKPEIFCVPVNPNGPYLEQGPGGRTWGLTKPEASTHEHGDGQSNWQISPSINVLDDRDAVAGTHEHPSIWHQTPEISNVPDDEAWIGSAP
jgi:hypothetical protein